MALFVPVVKRDGQIPIRYAFRLSFDTTIGMFKMKLAEASSLLPNSFEILCLNRAGQIMVFCTDIFASLH